MGLLTGFSILRLVDSLIDLLLGLLFDWLKCLIVWLINWLIDMMVMLTDFSILSGVEILYYIIKALMSLRINRLKNH